MTPFGIKINGGLRVSEYILSFRGESTLNPDLIKIIKYAKQNNIKEVSFLTNGSRLSEEYFEELLLAGVDWIIISFDGLNEEYEKNRYPLKFNEMYNKLLKIKEIKTKYKSEKPVIKVQAVWPSIEADPFKYYEKLSLVTDMVSFLPLIEYNLENLSKDCYIENFSCPMIYQRLFVTSDGKVLPCCGDNTSQIIIGDAYCETIYDIWHGEKLNNIRKAHMENYGFYKIDACKKCFIPRKTRDDIFVYGDKKIVVKNYVK
ncbi:radical SAM protein [Coprococcus sp. MSK.21.13]|nr:radical SAM protein [Coprococcus sp. MSK.21.13]